MADCLFCKIAKKEIPGYLIYEDKEAMAFLDIFPASKAQALVIPKKHYSYIFDMPDKEYSSLLLKSKKIAKAIDKAFSTVRTSVIVEGFAVDHVHIRLHPCYERHLNLKPMRNKPSEKELQDQVKKIKTLLK